MAFGENQSIATGIPYGIFANIACTQDCIKNFNAAQRRSEVSGACLVRQRNNPLADSLAP
jgi:hypothetical protein